MSRETSDKRDPATDQHDHPHRHREHDGDHDASRAASKAQRDRERPGPRERQDIQGPITEVKDDGDECHIKATFRDAVDDTEIYMMYQMDAFLMKDDFASKIAIYKITRDDLGRPTAWAVTNVSMTQELKGAEVVINPSTKPTVHKPGVDLRSRITSRVIVMETTPVAVDGAVVDKEVQKVRITVGGGATHGVALGMTVVLTQNGRPLRGGAFTLDRVNPTRCSGLVDLTCDQVDQADGVIINPSDP